MRQISTSLSRPRGYRHAGQLYQLFSSRTLDTGAYVAVNGPYDTYGVVQKCTPQEDGRFLNLIRGIKPSQTLTPAYQF